MFFGDKDLNETVILVLAGTVVILTGNLTGLSIQVKFGHEFFFYSCNSYINNS